MAWTLAALLVGCRSAEPPAPAGDPAAATAASEAKEAQSVADAALGKQAEILDRGDLARNGREQLLVVNRLGKAPGGPVGSQNEPALVISRAVVLEKSEGKWREIFRCDEHLKNPYGYLAAAGSAATGWHLVVGGDPGGPLEMEFTPAHSGDRVGMHTGERKEARNPTFVVRWNTKANRYQAYDRSQKRYLRETTALETPESILR
jgi:hypothetical protein